MSEDNIELPRYPQGDLVLLEIWRAKDTLSAAYDHDLDRLFAQSRAREKVSGHRVVNLSRSGKPRNP